MEESGDVKCRAWCLWIPASRDPQDDVTLQVQLLGAVVEEPGNLKCRVWARELMELLYPLAARSRIVAALLLQARCKAGVVGLAFSC